MSKVFKDKILILGASILQLPAIKKAKEMGFHVVVVDININAIGSSYADEFYNISTNDINGITELAKEIQPKVIMTIATDMPMRAIASATSELNIKGISYITAIKATDKGEMIQALNEANVNIPWYFIVKDKNELKDLDIIYPCILKPIDSSGSRGVILVNCENELESAYLYSKKYSNTNSVIIEEYMIGKEVSVEILVINGDVNVLAVTDKITTGQPYFVEMGHSQQSQLENSEIEEIKELARKAVKAIGIIDGPAHVEIMMTKEGAKIVEIGARLGGDCITSHLVKLSTGIDMIEQTINILAENEVCIHKKYNRGSAILYIEADEGVISEIQGIDEAKKIQGIEVVQINKKIGDLNLGIKSSGDRIGFVIAQGDNAKEAINICKKAIEKIKIVIK